MAPSEFSFEWPLRNVLHRQHLDRINSLWTALRHAASCVSSVETRAARGQVRATCSKIQDSRFLIDKARMTTRHWGSFPVILPC